MYAVAI
ncbi:hypothetical protein D030_2504A, partial [Vibrio parahaemolyticus AQ3810]